MGHGELPGRLHLLAEDRDHASDAAQDVAEPDRHEHRRFPFPVHIVDDEFRHALGRPHHVGGSHRLVRGHENEPGDAVPGRRFRDDPRPEDVRLHRLHGVHLHHRHVLVRRRVVDHDRPVGAQDLFDPGPVPHISDHGDQVEGRELLPHLHLEGEQGALRDLEEQEPRG